MEFHVIAQIMLLICRHPGWNHRRPLTAAYKCPAHAHKIVGVFQKFQRKKGVHPRPYIWGDLF